MVRFDTRYLRYVGLTLCDGEAEFRAYMASSQDGPFLPVTDTGGHGQDHCELVNDNFQLPNEDDIKSGKCPSCDTSENLPLEHVDTWSRGQLGSPFTFAHSGECSYQTSRLKCGVVFGGCGPQGPSGRDAACAEVVDGIR